MTKRDEKINKFLGRIKKSATSSTQAMAAGVQLKDRYEIKQVKLEGADFIVYEALDTENQKPCLIIELFVKEALDRLYPNTIVVKSGQEDLYQLKGNDFIYSFSKLKKAAGQPGLLQVQDLFMENQSAYAAAEMIEAVPLNEYMKGKGALPLEQARRWYLELLPQIGQLHDLNLRHSNLNSQTIWANDQGLYAAVFGQQYGKNVPGDETSPYQAPEQVRPEPSLLNQSDIYALNAVLFYLLTGQEIPAAKKREEGTPVGYPAGWKQEWIDFFELGLNLDPASRTRSVHEMSDYLAMLPGGRQPKKKAAGPARKKTRRSGSGASTIMAGLILIAAGTGLALCAPIFDHEASLAQTTKEVPGSFKSGTVSANAIEALQTVDVDKLELTDCDFAGLDESLLSENPTIKSITIKNPVNLTSLNFLQKFPQLQQLNLAGCQLNDQMVADAKIGTLTSLEKIDVSGNQLTTLDFAANLPNLKQLNAANNQIIGMEPLQELPALEYVNLAGNQIGAFHTLQTKTPVTLILDHNPLFIVADHGQDGVYYQLLSLLNTPLLEQPKDQYQALALLQGDVLLINYAYNDVHVDANGVNQVLSVLAYDNFKDNVFVNVNATDQERILESFAAKPVRFMSSEEAENYIKDFQK